MELKRDLQFILSLIILVVSISLFLTLFLISSGYLDMSSEPELTAETNTSGVPFVEASNNSKIDGERLEMAVFEEVNENRQIHGEDPFVHSERIRLIARLHSSDMGKKHYFNHTSLDGDNPRDRHKKYQGCENPNENIAKIGTPFTNDSRNIAERVVTMWSNSPGHNTTMMSDYYHVSGVGVYVTSNRSVYVTMNFCREHPNA